LPRGFLAATHPAADCEIGSSILPGSGAVAGWRINADGTLDKIGETPIVVPGIGLLDTIDGDVAMCVDDAGGLEPCEFGPGGSPAGIEVF
jgi:hypothetical protein